MQKDRELSGLSVDTKQLEISVIVFEWEFLQCFFGFFEFSPKLKEEGDHTWLHRTGNGKVYKWYSINFSCKSTRKARNRAQSRKNWIFEFLGGKNALDLGGVAENGLYINLNLRFVFSTPRNPYIPKMDEIGRSKFFSKIPWWTPCASGPRFRKVAVTRKISHLRAWHMNAKR